MTTTTMLIVSAIASAFLLFGGLLAWGDFYSRGARQESVAPKQPVSADPPAPFEHRRAA